MDDKSRRRYLLGELFWELEQHPEVGAAIRLVTMETVEVISFSGYDNLIIRVGSQSYRARLTWQKDQPPLIEPVDSETTQTIAELDAMHTRAKAAFERRDLAAYRDLFASDLKYHQPDGRTIGRDRLMRDVAAQFHRLNRVQSSFVRDHIEIGEDRATETLRQTGYMGVTVFGFVHRTWKLFRKGRYTWRKAGGHWLIEEVEVLEEQVSPGTFQLGFRPPSGL